MKPWPVSLHTGEQNGKADNTERTGRGALDIGAAVPANAGAHPADHPQGVRLSCEGNSKQDAADLVTKRSTKWSRRRTATTQGC